MEIYLCNLTLSVCLESLKDVHNRGFLQLNFLFIFPSRMGIAREEGIYHFYYFHSIQLHDFISCSFHIILLIVGGSSRKNPVKGLPSLICHINYFHLSTDEQIMPPISISTSKNLKNYSPLECQKAVSWQRRIYKFNAKKAGIFCFSWLGMHAGTTYNLSTLVGSLVCTQPTIFRVVCHLFARLELQRIVHSKFEENHRDSTFFTENLNKICRRIRVKFKYDRSL